MKKMDISNKTLAMFLVAAIVVSIAGTTISLNKLGGVGSNAPTGYATTDIGNVTINIGAAVSIIINTTGSSDTLAFGCTPSGDSDVIINSENTSDTPTYCPTNPNNATIKVYNDGNVDANVSINVSNVGENTSAHTGGAGTFLSSPGSNSWIAYRIFNGTNVGCAGNQPSGYNNFTTSGVFHQACDNLSYPNGDFHFAVEMLLPKSADTVTGDYVEVTFWAKERT